MYKIIRKLITLTALVMTVACASADRQAPQAAEPKSAAAETYQVINLGPNFVQFWSQARTKPFDEQVRLWDQLIENPNQKFYDAIVWQKSENPKWEERKIRRLKYFFGRYPILYPEIAKLFGEFDGTLKSQIAKFTATFPDARFDLQIYAVPSTTFNGKGGESGDGLGKTVLAFGIDMIADLHGDTDVLYSHELFHIYHAAAVGINEKVFLGEGRLTLPLWMEGFATFVSAKMNPTAIPEVLLMDSSLPKVSEADIRWMAGHFLKEANEKAFDAKKPEIYKKWFAIDEQYNVRKDLPHRSGYLLGLRVVQHLAKNYELKDMVHWSVPVAHGKVIQALAEISQTPK